jgi:hypothetical protein
MSYQCDSQHEKNECLQAGGFGDHYLRKPNSC